MQGCQSQEVEEALADLVSTKPVGGAQHPLGLEQYGSRHQNLIRFDQPSGSTGLGCIVVGQEPDYDVGVQGNHRRRRASPLTASCISSTDFAFPV